MKKFYILAGILFFVFKTNAQQNTLLISQESAFYYEKFIHTDSNYLETEVRPILYSILNEQKIDSFLNFKSNNSLISNLLNNDLYAKRKDKLSYSVNPIISTLYSQLLSENKNAYLLEGGLSLVANYRNKLALQSNFSLTNQQFFNFDSPQLIEKQIVPHYGKALKSSGNSLQYALFDARISYSPSKYFNLQTGYGKNFIGSGYRSLFLSDNANSYPFFKANAHFWKIDYHFIHAALKHLDESDADFNLQNKWAVMHYIGLNLSRRIHLGFFETVISNPNNNVTKRGFEVNYLNPLVFIRPIDYNLGSPDNVILGLSAKVVILKKVHLYSQFLIDEFDFKQLKKRNGYWANKIGVQAGFKAFDAFKVKNLFLQGEINTVRPYTYSHGYPITNYGHYYQALAHIYGANFYEALGIVNYDFTKRLSINLKSKVAIIGLDSNNEFSVGQDIFKSYSLHENNFENDIAQGDENQLFLNDLTVNFLINPKWNTLAVFQISNLIIKKENATNSYNFISFGIRSNVFPKMSNSRFL